MVLAVRMKARAERKQREVLRWVTSIFDRLHATDTEKVLVSE